MSVMPSPFPCCPDPCPTSPVNVPIPGPQGPAGQNATPCTPCINGENAFTTLTGNFTMPAELANSASTPVADSSPLVVGQIVFLLGIGSLQVISKADSTHVVLKNMKDTANSHYMANAAPGTIVGVGSTLSQSGFQGPDGAAGSITGPAGGDLTGTYPNPTIDALKVTTGKIALLAVTDAQVAAANKDGAAGTPSMRTIGAGATQCVAGNDSRLTDARTPTGAAGGGLAGTYPNPTLNFVQSCIQCQVASSATAQAFGGGWAWDDSIPQIGLGTEVLTVTITPISAASKLIIEALAPVSPTANTQKIIAALFQDAVANALTAIAVSAGTANFPVQVALVHEVASGSTTARTYRLRLGTSDGNPMGVNGDDAGNRKFGGTQRIWLKVTEVP